MLIIHGLYSSAMSCSQPWPRSSLLHQTFIGYSSQNKLIIQDTQARPRQDAFLLRLPDEILVTICDLATLDPDPCEPVCEAEMPPLYEVIKALALVCHRFHQIALPLLYRTIRFDKPHLVVPPTNAVKSLNRSLQQNSSLRRHCRVLVITINDCEPWTIKQDFSIAKNLISWLNEVRCLKLVGGFGCRRMNNTRAFCRIVCQYLSRVEHLFVSRNGWDIYFAPIVEQLNVPSLRLLQVSGKHYPRNIEWIEMLKLKVCNPSPLICLLSRKTRTRTLLALLRSSKHSRLLIHVSRMSEQPLLTHCSWKTSKVGLLQRHNSSSGHGGSLVPISHATPAVGPSLICPSCTHYSSCTKTA